MPAKWQILRLLRKEHADSDTLRPPMPYTKDSDDVTPAMLAVAGGRKWYDGAAEDAVHQHEAVDQDEAPHRARKHGAHHGAGSIHDAGTPTLIYHVVQVSVWDKACAAGTEYYPPTYAADGFIHATHDGALLLDVLNHFYKTIDDDFLCLELSAGALTSPVKMEDPAPVGDKAEQKKDAVVLFPHIYGPITPLSCVVRKMAVKRDKKDGTFLRIEGLYHK